MKPAGGNADPGADHGGVVEQLVFRTPSRDAIRTIVDGFCARELGTGIAEILFRETSVGVVFGLLLDDGRRVVVKAHQPRETRPRLQAVRELQSVLFRAGVPCPEPICGPLLLVNADAVVETLLDAGEFRDTHDPLCRRLIAEALAWHLAITGEQARPAALDAGWSLPDGDRLWPVRAHSPIFDFSATSAGAEWIDDLAAQAKAAIVPTGDLIAGHSDWSGKHFRFTGDAITAIYDWDSLQLRSEAAIVGTAAMTFTTRFDLPGVPRAPSPEEMRAFIDEYSAARPIALTRDQRAQIAVHGMLVAAYTARCEHCAIAGYDAGSDLIASRVHCASTAGTTCD